jgi:hypothetical protein
VNVRLRRRVVSAHHFPASPTTLRLPLGEGWGFRRALPCSLRATSVAVLLGWIFLTPHGAIAITTEDQVALYRKDLESLAAKCDELGLAEQAQITREWIIPRHPGRQYLFLPAASDPAAPPAAAGETVKQWYRRFRELRSARAEHLFGAARSASDAGRPALAYQLLFETLRENPDHALARRILDVASSPPRFTTSQPRLVHPKLGWAAGRYWRIETPHFAIQTNHSAREGQELARHAEELYALWQQTFFRYWSSGEALAARFAGRDEPLARERPKMNILLVKDRAEYVRQLEAAVPQIGQTVGIYLSQQRTSFFVAGDASVVPTWNHEITHQLFQESVPDTVAQPGESQNFWALEGAALYMESLTRHGGFWTVGGCESDRLQFARYRTLAGDGISLSRLSALSREAIQTSPDIVRIYSQSAGYAHFLMDGERGTRRDAFVDLLAALYRGGSGESELAAFLGSSEQEFDERFRAFLNVTDADLAGIPSLQRLRNLSLGRTRVTDAGLVSLADSRELIWLDLSLLDVTDEGFRQVAEAKKLEQLFLEGTKLTDAALPQVGTYKQLTELDLSALAITDDGLTSLSGLPKLSVLYLSNSPITDMGLTHLRSLKQLTQLDTTGTRVTDAGLEQLRRVLPKLRGE